MHAHCQTARDKANTYHESIDLAIHWPQGGSASASQWALVALIFFAKLSTSEGSLWAGVEWLKSRGPRWDVFMPKGSRGGGGGYRSASYSTGVYTASGARVRNPAAYAATGAQTYTAAGKAISDPVAYAGAIEASVRQNTSAPKYLYHYTDPSSASAIASSGKLKRSTGRGDCALGEGVYFTAKPPKSKSSALLNNNYGGASSLHGESKVSAYVRIEADSVNYHNGRRDLGRDVFVVHGDVDLRQSGAKLGQRH